jgi:hypothetical protein
MKANKKKKPEKPATYTFSDEKTRKKVKKHIQDITDTISEEDIKNVKVPGAKEAIEKGVKDKNVLEGDNIAEEIRQNTDGKQKHTTPWDILDE